MLGDKARSKWKVGCRPRSSRRKVMWITQECAKWRTGTKVGSDTGGKPLQGEEAKLFVLC
jgi:hypothetical protein